MNDRVVNIVISCAIGCAATGIPGLCFWFSRSYRKAKNRVAILLCQLSVMISVLGGLFLLEKLERIAAPDNKSVRESALYAFLVGLFSVGFFVMRSEIFWRGSWTSVRANTERPPVNPEARRRFFAMCGFGICSWILALAALFLRTKPLAPLLFGSSLFSLLAPMIFMGRAFGTAIMREFRNGVVFISGLGICFCGWVGYKSQVNAPTQTSAWLVSIAILCVVFLSALLFLRPESEIQGP